MTTGVGAALNKARVHPGSTVAVYGGGGVGLSIVMGAVLSGAAKIIVIDRNPAKESLARSFGATHFVSTDDGTDPVGAVRELTGGVGADYAFEALGRAETIRQAYDALRPGGMAVVVGMAPEDDEVAINALSLPRNVKVLMGSYYGSARPWIDLPRLVNLYLSQRLRVDELVSRSYRLDEINTAYEALAAGEVARSVIVFD